jgi:hypothetical protein
MGMDRTQAAAAALYAYQDPGAVAEMTGASAKSVYYSSRQDRDRLAGEIYGAAQAGESGPQDTD